MQERNESTSEELRDFLLVVRRALLMLVAYIDKRYLNRH